MKTNFFLFLFGCFLSQSLVAQAEKDSLLARDAHDIIEELRFLYQLDQSTRKYLDYATFDKKVVDSIEGLDRDEIKAAVTALQLTQETKDRLWDKVLSPLDSLKTVRMLEIINTYGYPAPERLEELSGQDIDFNPTIILVHSPFSFKDEIIPLLEEEYKAGNISDRCEYGYLLWHLHGRSDFKYMLENGYEMQRNEDGTFNLVSTCR